MHESGLLDSYNTMYLTKINNMTPKELISEFTDLCQLRNSSDKFDYSLQFSILATVARRRKIKLPDDVADEEFETPDSSSIKKVRYNYVGKILYVTYKSGGKTYEFPNVERSTFQRFKSAKSKGNFIHFEIKNKIRHN